MHDAEHEAVWGNKRISDLPRPKEFDVKLMKYFDMIHGRCTRITKDRKKGYDMAVDVLEHCLRNWDGFKNDGNYFGFHNWLVWQIKGMKSNHIVSQKAGSRSHGGLVELDSFPIGVQDVLLPNTKSHESQVDALLQIARLSSSKDGMLAIRNAYGVTLTALGKEIGVSTERVRQRVARFREAEREKT